MSNSYGLEQPKKTNATRVQKLSALAIAIGGLSISTQYFAAKFSGHAALGSNLGGIYPPYSILGWWLKWADRYPNEFYQAMVWGGTSASVGFMGLIVGIAFAKNSASPIKDLHGSARWANKADIIEAGLLPKPPTLIQRLRGENEERKRDKVVVGGWTDNMGKFHYLYHDGPEHIAAYAPTRSGKGVSLVVPTLLTWGASVVVNDLKGELWAFTAGWRQQYAKNKVIRFDPSVRGKWARWNPLDEIRLGTEYEVGDAQNLALIIVDPDGKGLNDHWSKTAFSLLTGLILHVLFQRESGNIANASLASIDAIISDPEVNLTDVWSSMQTSPRKGTDKPHPTVASAGQDIAGKPENEAGSVISTVKSYLSLYRDPIVAENTSASDFTVTDLMNDEKPVSLYINAEPADKDRLRPIIRVLLNMIIRKLAAGMEFENGRAVTKFKHRLLAMIDEFPSLGKLDILQESLSYVAGYGIKFYLIAQDTSQIKSKEKGYGPEESITSNCHIQIAFSPTRLETAEYLSKLSGTTTVVKENISASGTRFRQNRVNKSYTETSRPLLTPDEVGKLPAPIKDANDNIIKAGDVLISVAGMPMIRGTQSLFFLDDLFLARVKIKAPDASDVTIARATAEQRVKT